MTDCCKKDLGRFPHNEDIDTTLTASMDGEYEFFFSGINGTEFSIKATFETGDALVIPKNKLNEDMLYKVQVKDPNGDLIETDDCPNYLITTYIKTQECNTCDEEEAYV